LRSTSRRNPISAFPGIRIHHFPERLFTCPGFRTLPDFEERQHWNEYQEAYQDALRKCSTERAPWYVIPANRKWLRNHVIAELIVKALDDMKLKYPAPTVDISKVVLS
jgi:hypothetical protein